MDKHLRQPQQQAHHDGHRNHLRRSTSDAALRMFSTKPSSVGFYGLLCLALCWCTPLLAHPSHHNAASPPSPQTAATRSIPHRRWIAARRTRKRKQPPSKPINLNTATAKELVQLPRIGRSKALKILELRKSLGGKFTSISQITKVRGIGKRTFAKLRPYLTLDGTAAKSTTGGDTGDDDPPPPSAQTTPRGKRKRKKRSKKRKRSKRKRRKKRAKRSKRRSWRGSWRSKSQSGDRNYDNPPVDPSLDGDDGDGQPVRRTSAPKTPQGSQDTDPIVPQPSATHDRTAPPRRRWRKSRKGKGPKGKRRNCYQRWQDRHGDRFVPLNINVATAKELRTLPCIGKKRATSIIAIRGTMGPFLQTKDLRKVSGVGKKILGWLTPLVRFRLNVNTATLAQLEALRPLSGGLGEAIFKYRKKRGPFRQLKHLMRVRGLGRGDYHKLKVLLTIDTPKASPSQPKVIKID